MGGWMGEGGYSLYAELKRGKVGRWVSGREGWREGGAGRRRSLGSLVVLEALVEEEVGRQVLILLAGEVGLDHQRLRETQRF